ncbi:MAG: hypothetical protein Q9162_001724 [Coniocarpon cinnabarinum]
MANTTEDARRDPQAHTASPTQSLPTVPSSSASDSNTSRITLNLRTPTDRAATSRALSGQYVGDNPRTKSAEVLDEPRHINQSVEDDEIEVLDASKYPPPKQSSPPVVDISLDDSGSEKEDNDTSDAVENVEVELSQLARAFPWHQSFFDDTCLSLHRLEELAAWFDQWISVTQERPELWPRLYTKHHQDFIYVGQCMFKILSSKKYNFASKTSHRTTLADSLRRLFESYLDLCSQLASSDLNHLQQGSQGTLQLRCGERNKHLKNLNLLLFRPETTSLWRLAAEMVRLDRRTIVLETTPRLLITSQGLSSAWFDLGASLAEALKEDASLCDTVYNIITIGNEALANLVDCVHEGHSRQQEMARVQHRTSESILRMQAALIELMEKQSSNISSDSAHSLLDHINRGWETAMTAEADEVQNAIEPWAQVGRNMSPSHFSRLQGLAMSMITSRRLISKGRLESRARATQTLGSTLHQLYEFTREFPPATAEHIRMCTGSWLLEQQVVSQILSVDTHPEVVHKSRSTLGYLLVTGSWTPALTSIVFEVISASQDGHLKHSIFSALTGVVQFATLDFCTDFTILLSQSPEAMSQLDIVVLFVHVAYIYWAKREVSEVFISILQVALKIMRLASSRIPGEPHEAHQILHETQTLMRSAVRSPASDGAVEQLMHDCVSDIQECSVTTFGSVSAIDTILDMPGMDQKSLTNLLVDALSAPDILSRCLVSITADEEREPSVRRCLDPAQAPLMSVLFKLMTFKPTCRLERDSEPALWRCLVGELAVNDAHRDFAYHMLAGLCERADEVSPLIERCLHEFLPGLNHHYFTNGLIKFSDSAMRYQARLGKLWNPNDQGIMRHLLPDFLWKVVLDSLSEDVAHMAVMALCSFHVKLGPSFNAPPDLVRKLLTEFVHQAIQELDDCGRRILSTAERPVVNHTAPDSGVDSMRFKRVVRCIHVLLNEAQKEPILVCVLDERRSASPKSATQSPTSDFVTIRYQAFPPGSTIAELRIDPSAPLHELYEVLRRKTRFSELKTIHGGQVIDLRALPDSTVSSIVGKPGLMLVKNASDDKLLPSSLDVSGSQTVVGNAIMMRFESLYALLGLPEALSMDVFILMRQFPPFEHVVLTLESEVAPSDLFHPKHRYKTLYNLHCLLQIITSLDVRKADSHDRLRRISQKLINAFTNDSTTVLDLDTGIDQEIAEAFVQGLLHCVRALAFLEILEAVISQATEITSRLCEILLSASRSRISQITRLARTSHDCVMELAYLSKESLVAFIEHPRAAEIHEWLLIRNADVQLRYFSQRRTQDLARFARERHQSSLTTTFPRLWKLLISILPATRSCRAQSYQFFQLMTELCASLRHPQDTDGDAHHLVSIWFGLLVERNGPSRLLAEVPEPFVYGLSKLILAFLHSSSIAVPDEDAITWVNTLFQSLLFPPICPEGAQCATLSASTASALHSETRKQIYDLALVLSSQARPFAHLLSLLRELTVERIPDDLLSWRQNRSSLIRSTTGYAGLRNLTNTCYMNSLIAQLYMNPKFRNFILSMPVSDLGGQKLLAATRDLFCHMQQSQRKFADTEQFAYSIKPLEGPVIDVAVQMDVDEFYNLLFEQWEDQINTRESKQEFRAIYGGTSVTQVKSLDCDHISERTEEYMTISCEVKGKQTLTESLQAFTAGDAMEGDNKYKCESCGNRYVNAVKRSCLKDIPDNLAFHLKRFDFDLETMQRRKLHDYFAFPREIDMAPYKYEAVAENRSCDKQDVFELVGVLVHSGTAEIGHYYSYIRDSATPLGIGAPWYEFNDIDVSEFDPKKLEDCCFGGSYDTEQWRNVAKMNCAYMLFYKRHAQDSQIDKDRSAVPAPTPPEEEQAITDIAPDTFVRENDLLIRWYSLMDPQHGTFLQSLMTHLEESCRHLADHSHHSAIATLVDVVANYLQLIGSRLQQPLVFEQTAFALESMVSICDDCSADALDVLVEGNPSPLSDMLLHCPDTKIRTQTEDFLLTLMGRVRSSESPAQSRWGLSASADSAHGYQTDPAGVFPRVMELMLFNMNEIGFYADRWGQHFSVLRKVCRFGQLECYALLSTDLLFEAMVLLFTIDFGDAPAFPLNVTYWQHNRAPVNRLRKYVRGIYVLELIASLAKYVDFSEAYHGDPGDRLSNAHSNNSLLPLTANEQAVAFLEDEKNSAFVARCMEATPDEDGEVYAAKSVVAQMLHNAEDVTKVKPLWHTIIRQVQDYDFLWQHLPLAVAVPVCQFCPSPELVQQLLRTVQLKAVDLGHDTSVPNNAFRRLLEFKDQNGKVFTRFFTILSAIKEARCSDEDYFLRRTILQGSSKWAPALLLYDSTENRVEAQAAVQNLVLKDVEPPSEEEEHLGDEDILRIQTWALLVINGIALYHGSRKQGATATMGHELIQVLDACMSRLKKFERQQRSVPAFQPVYESIHINHGKAVEQWTVAKDQFDRNFDMEAMMVDEDGGK